MDTSKIGMYNKKGRNYDNQDEVLKSTINQNPSIRIYKEKERNSSSVGGAYNMLTVSPAEEYPHPQQNKSCSRDDTKLDLIGLLFWRSGECETTFSFSLLPGLLWGKVPVRIPSMGQIDLFKIIRIQ